MRMRARDRGGSGRRSARRSASAARSKPVGHFDPVDLRPDAGRRASARPPRTSATRTWTSSPAPATTPAGSNRVAPATMIMCPCVGGLSHNEAEDISKEWATAGADVLLQRRGGDGGDCGVTPSLCLRGPRGCGHVDREASSSSTFAPSGQLDRTRERLAAKQASRHPRHGDTPACSSG